MFDGKSLAGWTQRGGTARYFVEDGAIVGETVPQTPNSFLCTEELFGDFLLELEFLVDRELNSGVQIRSQSLADYRQGVVHGYQVEIDPSDRGWTAGIYDESRRGWLQDLSDRRRARYAFRQGEWNHLRVAAIGDRIRTWLNGVAVADLRDNQTAEGFIGLQVHGVGGRADPLRVRFRNIRVQTRPPARVMDEEDSLPASPASIFPDGAELVAVATGFRFAEGPAVGPDGAIYFSDIPSDRIHRFDPTTGATTVFREPSGQANGLFFTAAGALVACESQTRVVSRLENGQRRVLADAHDGQRLNSPNDIVPDGHGGFYFTDPRYGDRQSMEMDVEGVYYIDRQGRLARVEATLTRPNGLILSPDGKRLYVADHAGSAVWAYDVIQAGTVENKTPFADVGSDGMTVDAYGNVFVTWRREVIAYTPQGVVIDRIALPENPTNCTLRGPDLYVTTPGSLYRVRTHTLGWD